MYTFGARVHCNKNYNTLQNYKQRSAARNGGQQNVMRTTTTNVVRTIAPALVDATTRDEHASHGSCGGDLLRAEPPGRVEQNAI